MTKFLKPLIFTSLTLTSVLVLAGCGSSGGSSSGSFNLDTIQAKLLTVAPKCILEKVNIPKEGTVNGFVAEKLVVENLIDHLTDYGDFLENPENLLATYKDSGYYNSRDENVFSWKLNSVSEIYICNTNGVPLAGLNDWDKNIEEGFDPEKEKCTSFYEPYSKSDAVRAKNCIEKLNSIERNGEWVVLTTTNGVTPEKLISTFMTSHNKTWPASKKEFSATATRPVAYTENFTVNFATAGFYWSEKKNSVRNELWLSIVKTLNATTWNELDVEGAGYPGDYLNSWFRPSGDPSSVSIRETELQKVINPEAKIVECSSNLKVNVNTASSSDCGKLKVEVFQSDLNTGGCTFLANWNDSSGSSRVGIFRYCDAFTSGSIVEDSYYTIRVRVDGPESYTTTTGTQSRVLGFTVLGN